MPLPGQAIDIGKNNSGSPGDPVFDGMSYDGLNELIKAFVNQERPVTRGAREVAVFRQASPAVVLIKTQEGFGSGVVLQNGMVITNRHVVEGVGKVQLFFKPDDLTRDDAITETRSGTVKAVDRQRDLALIAPESLPANVKFLKISTRDDLEVGADVYAIGHPLGYTWTFTQGIVSGMRAINTDEQNYTAVQTQTPINPGNSGALY
jgi:S1-C subfamily serine protease